MQQQFYFNSLCVSKNQTPPFILKELQRRSTEEATTTVAAMTKKNVPKNRGTCIPCALIGYIEIQANE